MSDLRSVGQLIDEWLTDRPGFETLIFYHDKHANPHIVVTGSEPDMDWLDVFSEDIDLKANIEQKKKRVAQLEAKIRGLEKEKSSVEKAISKIAEYSSKAVEPLEETV